MKTIILCLYYSLIRLFNKKTNVLINTLKGFHTNLVYKLLKLINGKNKYQDILKENSFLLMKL